MLGRPTASPAGYFYAQIRAVPGRTGVPLRDKPAQHSPVCERSAAHKLAVPYPAQMRSSASGNDGGTARQARRNARELS